MTEPIRLEFMDGLRFARSAVQQVADGHYPETYVPGGDPGLAAALKAIDQQIAFWNELIQHHQPTVSPPES